MICISDLHHGMNHCETLNRGHLSFLLLIDSLLLCQIEVVHYLQESQDLYSQS